MGKIPTTVPSGPGPVITGRHKLGGELVKALGLEGHRVQRVVIEVDVREPVRLTVTELVDVKKGETIVRTMELIEPSRWQEVPEGGE